MVVSNEPLVRLQRISKSFEEGGQRRVVLNELSATFARGEVVALLGRSGSGKSTLLNLISGIDLPSAGEISVGDTVLTRLSERERTLFRRRAIGFVFQFFNLISTLTVLENLLLPLELNGAADAQGRRRALDLLEQVGMAERATTYPDRLSGGEQQRIAVARALVHDPLLVLADEPTGNLDADTSDQVTQLLDRLTRQAGKTMLLVTHSADLAATADRIFRMHEGHLVSDQLTLERMTR
jgi:putative ABC transport system ATP-binding protein